MLVTNGTAMERRDVDLISKATEWNGKARKGNGVAWSGYDWQWNGKEQR